MTTGTVTFRIPGKLTGKGRPRATLVAGRPRLYTPAETRSAETRVRDAWRAAGSPYLGDGPLTLELVIGHERPAGHWTSRGDLSAAGRRMPFPAKKPDADNQLKLLADALNGCLWKDDAQIVEARIVKVWMRLPGMAAYSVVSVAAAVEVEQLLVPGMPAATLFQAELGAAA